MSAQLHRLLKRCVDYECGLINFIAEVPTIAGEPDVQIYIAEYQDPIALFPERQHLRVGTAQASGAGLSKEEAMWSTLGEALERYSAHTYRQSDILFAAAPDIAGGSEFLHSIILFSDEDYGSPAFRFRRPDYNLTRGWAAATNLVTGERCHVPASVAYMSYEARTADEILDQIYSTGLASHTSLEKALLTALCEVVERDAYACHWLTGAKLKSIRQSDIEACLPPPFLKSCASVGFDFVVAALPTDIDVPVFVALASLPGGGIATGAACRPKARDAITKSVVECAHTFNWCLDMKRSGIRLDSESSIRSFQDHVAWYLSGPRSDAYPWNPTYINSETEIPAAWQEEDASNGLSDLVSKINRVGYTPIYVEMTPPDVRELGFFIVKVFVPGLQPLSAGYDNVHTDLRRLKRFKGQPHFTANRADLANPPHAFP